MAYPLTLIRTVSFFIVFLLFLMFWPLRNVLSWGKVPSQMNMYITMWKNKASFLHPSLSITILYILYVAGESVRPHWSCLQRQRLALFGVSNKMIHIFMRAFEFSYRASALVTHPELLGPVSNTWTAVAELGHWCINQMSIEEKRITVMGKICRFSESGVFYVIP